MRLKTFGGLAIISEGGPPVGAATQRRRLALLALIAGTGDRGISRDKLQGYLWPDAEPEKGRRVLAQALYALRRDMGADDLFLGTADLRLNPEVISSDHAEFCAAMNANRLEQAASLYSGPFLDGFYVNEAPEFERWVEMERGALYHQYVVALEKLARQAGEKGQLREAVGWWRKLAASDPLNSQTALGLMKALAAAGDAAGALQHARVFETLLREEMGMSPDAAVVALVRELRTEGAAHTPPPPPAFSIPRPSAPAGPVPSHDRPIQSAETAHHLSELGVTSGWATAAPPPIPKAMTSIAPRRRFGKTGLLISAIFLLLIVAFGFLFRNELTGGSRPAAAVPVVAVGRFQDYTEPPSSLVRPLADMLATNLARAQGLQVVSSARMYELLSQGGGEGDTAASIVTAARRAGATELVEGAVYSLGAGRMRLDLRRIELASGSVRQAYTVEGTDLFSLVENGTRELVQNLGVAAPGVPLAQVTTRSVVAYRLYEEGLRAYYKGDASASNQLFRSALAEDSLFAMAQFYAALSGPDKIRGLERAMQLADHSSSDRERLLIHGGWASEVNDPSQLAIAETLTVRYPTEPEGYLYLGGARVATGDFQGALTPFRRVLEMDSLGLRASSGPMATAPRCLACEAMGGVIFSYTAMDSFRLAERLARDWTRLQPGSISAWANLSESLRSQSRIEEALAARQAFMALEPRGDHVLWRLMTRFRGTDLDDVARELEARTREGTVIEQGDSRVWLTRTYRAQGRLRDALAVAREIRRLTPPEQTPGAAQYEGLYMGAVLYEMGQYRAAAALFDSVSIRHSNESASRDARLRTWGQTLRASALAAAGDTAGFQSLADSIQIWGSRSGYGRDPRLHHYVRGLLLAARGQPEAALAEDKLAIFSPVMGYSRINVDMAKTLLQLKRPLEAVAILESAMRGPYDGANTYVMPAELWELAAIANEAAGRREEAIRYYRNLLAVWKRADPEFRSRIERARLRLAALTGSTPN